MRNKIILLSILMVILGIGYYVWQKSRVVPIADLYKTAKAGRGDVTQTVSANGTLNPVILVNVGTQVSGTVKHLYADFNDHVKAGQVLAELDPALFRAQVGQSEANLANARATLALDKANEARSAELYKAGYIAKQDMDTATQARQSAQAQVDLALAQLARDKTNLNYSIIRSPVSGVVIDRQIDVGQTVAASFQTPTLFRIAQDLRNMQIDSSYAEADIGHVRVGQAVHFTVDAFPGRLFFGKVSQVRLNATVQQNVVTYDVVVSVNNPDQILKPGMTAYVNIVTAQKSDVLLVPNSALRFKPKGEKKGRMKAGTSLIYVIRNQQLEPVSVKTGITDNRMTEIVEGSIHEGDLVVTGDAKPEGEGSQSTFRMRML
ncbi:MAG TPA: efflux RND transporter periplasmic adaptor subunit [Burkholderiales bacterium]|nr:efflux RND transporter periplasmic adaptor subunit [Burkholderiales bacterium]